MMNVKLSKGDDTQAEIKQQEAWAHDLGTYRELIEEDNATLGYIHSLDKQPFCSHLLDKQP